nr:bifunctional glycoside hydrolase 114/ polysaccharide deacetylase family protein [Pseudomonas alcaligenes]
MRSVVAADGKEVGFMFGIFSSRSLVARAFRFAYLCLAGLLLPAALFAQSTPPSVAFWYAATPPLEELAQFDWVVLEPGHVSDADVEFLRAQGSVPFAYLSIGEVDSHQAQQLVPLVEAAASDIRNEAWDSQVMDLNVPAWREHLLSRAKALQVQGYSGLFLDTLDSFMLLPEEQREEQRLGLIAVLRELHARFPDLKLFFNRGFEVWPELREIVSAVAVESIHSGWDAQAGVYREVPSADRQWLETKLAAIRQQGVPVVALDYLPPERREEARQLARRLHKEGYVPFVSTPELNYLGVGSVEVQPRRIAMLYDPREGDLPESSGHVHLGGLLEYLGYRVDYFPADANLQGVEQQGLYAGVVVWMTSGVPDDSRVFNAWLSECLDRNIPVAFMAGMPVENAALLKRMGLRLETGETRPGGRILAHDKALVGSFEASLKMMSRDLQRVFVLPGGPQPALELEDAQGARLVPIAIGDWGGFALSPYVLEDGGESRRWMLDPFAFLQRALRLPALPAPDVTTENGRRIATVHIDGDGFPSRAEVIGTPYSGVQVLRDFIDPHPLLTSVSVVEGEVGSKGAFPHLARELEPIARQIFAHPRVEVASHTFSHPFYWQPEKASLRKGFEAVYGLNMKIPGYAKMDVRREIIGARDYINQRLTTAQKPVKLIFWSGDALPDAATIRMAYDAGLSNVNGGVTAMTRAAPSLTGLYPLLRPTEGGLQIYAPIINENVYTNLWKGPYYGFRGVIETFELTDTPRRLRGLNLYYHFYSATKQASIKVMGDIYRHIGAQQPLSLWMSDYMSRIRGLYHASLSRDFDGAWQVRSLQGLRTLRLDPALGWPDLLRSDGVAGVRDLPQGRYIHLAADHARLVLRPDRDRHVALEEANIPLTDWRYLSENKVQFSFVGEFALTFSVRAPGSCRVEVQGRQFVGRKAQGLSHFQLPMKQVRDARLTCS